MNKRLHLASSLLTMFTALLSLLPQTVCADDCVLENTSNYSVMPEGISQLRIKFPAYDKDGYDCWIVEGFVKIKIDGTTTEETIFECTMQQNIDNDDYFPNITFKKGVDGDMLLYRERNYSTLSVSRSSRTDDLPCMSNSETAYVNLLWNLPNKYRGKKVHISWSMHHNGNVSEPNKYITITTRTFDIAPAPSKQYPVLMDPVLSYSAGSPNQIMVPYMIATTNLQSMTAYYTEVGVGSSTTKSINLGTESSGFITLNAEQPVRNLYVEAVYLNSEKVVEKTASTTRDVPILHQPKALTATVEKDGKVTLHWMVGNFRWNEISPNDSWEIQRNVTGSSDPTDAGWMSIGQLSYDNFATEYSYTDENLLSFYQQKTVYYRVRRTFTSIWGWTAQSGYAMTSLPATLCLPGVTDATVERKGTWTDTEHGVKFQFRLGGPEKDSQGRLIIRNFDDWQTFNVTVENAKGQYDVNAVLAADITVNTILGWLEGSPYRGTFDGNGHTLTVNYDGSANSAYSTNSYIAPFRYVKNATFKNLHTAGTISTSGMYVGGLVGYATSGLVTIENCRSSVAIKLGTTGDGSNGGFMGANAGNVSVTFRNCAFDGSFDGDKCINNGGFVGWANSPVTIDNSLFAPTDITTSPSGSDTWARGRGATLTNCYYSLRYGTSSAGTSTQGMLLSDLQTKLGEQWQVQGSQVVPVMNISADSNHSTLVWDKRAKVALTTYMEGADSQSARTQRRELTEDEQNGGHLEMNLTTSCVYHSFELAVERGESSLPIVGMGDEDRLEYKLANQTGSDFYFDSNAKLISCKADTLQSAVSLSWETDGGDVDYYRILRYDKLRPEEVKTLETEYTQTAYIDQTVQPQHNYIYTIEGVTQCEGMHVTSIIREGCCEPTGMVRGYVRLANGIGLPNVKVTATPKNPDQGNEAECVTDSTGYYEISGLRYQGQGTYTLLASGIGKGLEVTFDEMSNLQIGINFYEQTYYNFSGFVLYEGSSIPVSGVSFLRDGMPVVDASGTLVTTDNQGAFMVNIPEGSHTIQVVKKGHVFANDGYYIDLDKLDGDPRKPNWQKDRSGVYLWDQTKVTLQGRVVGGNVEGLKPLGQSLSKNNLGDDMTMVLTLEGDNSSWIVRDQLDDNITERHYKVAHGKTDTTRVDAYRHRIVIHPDSATGEYQIPMYPVKYKVTEIYGKGYPTLFQAGMVSETVDLTNYANTDTATYSRIYHAQPTLDIWQFQAGSDRYLGLKQYISCDNAGIRDTITLWKNGTYSMGYPVFMAGSPVPMVLSAREEYYYNNEKLGRQDIVQLDGGFVRVGNGLVSVEESDTLSLDSTGLGTYVFTPENTTFMLEGDMALRTMKFTLEYDGTFFDIEPIRAYVMAAIPKSQGRHIVAGENVHLVDILRDPPGRSSSAYIAKGSKMSYSYTADYSIEMGASLSLSAGSGADYYTGIWAGVGSGTSAGTVNTSDNYGTLSYDLATKYYNDWSYEYEFETQEKITTSDHEREVGMNSDVYIGMTDNVVVDDAIAVRMVNRKAMQRLSPGMGGEIEVEGHTFNVAGTAKVLASGWDPVAKDSVYLVRDEVMSLSSRINSTFVHSQSYLLEELLPTLIRTRNSLLMDSTTTSTYAKTLANQQKRPVYVSKVAPENENFSLPNYYTRYLPEGKQDAWSDTIMALNTQIHAWAGLIAANEREKLEAYELVKVYDFDGRSSVEYSETFTTTDGMHRYWQIPSTPNLTGEDGFSRDLKDNNSGTKKNESDGKVTSVEFKAGGLKMGFKVTPLIGFDFNYENGINTEYTKETGFTLSCSRKSSLTVGVYKTREFSTDSLLKLADLGGMNLFYKNVENNLKLIYNGRPGSGNTTSYINSLASVPRYRNLVFRTLAGATASPWEEERRTMFYNPGAILDQATQQINKLRIWAKEPSVSNVPYGEPARFTIYMTNESDMPERISNEMYFYLEDSMNPNGAKVFVDGMPLTGTGIELWMDPGVIYEKQVEVYAGAEYDYDDLGITLYDDEDVYHTWTVSLSAHFVPVAGSVNISKPGNNWVVNTESSYDKERQIYYLPVHIDGFDVNFRNFDHIELQYKLSTQGDKDWVNVCSYYPDTDEGRELMALASGEKQLMKNNGFIDANFYGENDPVEQYYDIRAVCYCRHGSGYLTRSSNILSGIKDTRRPQPFGTPLPTNGILGIGDDIRIPFSENIAYNYLSPVNNFEVLGLTNQSSISLDTSLQFEGWALAVSMGKRNLAGKDFTFDLMMKPRQTGEDMSVVSQTMSDNTYMILGVTGDGHLTANVNGIAMQSEKAVEFDELRHVAYVFDVDEEENQTYVTFYNDQESIGSSSFDGMYDGTANLVFGSGFEGEMMEVRLWNKAMTSAELGAYAKKRLKGTELGLIDNYPMNEGSGEYAYDHAVGGNDLVLAGTTWKVPDGISMRLDGTEGIKLNPQPFQRTEYEDYTMMFWFRTNDEDCTLMSNGEARTESGWKDHFNIGLEDGKLFFRSGGQQVNASGFYHDGSWHHVAVSVNRAQNVGRLFVDEKLEQSFPVDTLGGIQGNALYLGTTFNAQLSTFNSTMAGYIDELAMFEMALPENVLKLISKNSPSGEEIGLLAYLPFSRSERQTDNTQRLMPTGLSLKKYKDNHGNIVENHVDTIVSEEVIALHADRRSYAPMVNAGKLENIKYSYVARDNELFINLDVPDYQIEKTNVYVTVKEVADLQGNLMASPVAMDFYVYRTPLRWNVKRKTINVKYGEGATVDLTIENLSGKTKEFTLEGMPQWITASQTRGKIDALDEKPIVLTISPYINIGDFEEIIYIVGENGMTEPLPLTIRVRGEAPDWAVDDELKRGNVTMHMVARVTIGDEIAHDTDDILTAVGTGHRTLGAAHVKQGTAENDGLVYMTIYNTAGANGTPVNFEFYDASTGRIHVVTPKNDSSPLMEESEATLLFQADTILGTATNPVILTANWKEVQAVKLEKGWNWASTYVQPEEATVSDLLNGMGTWDAGDGLELLESNSRAYLLTYKFDQQSNTCYWDNGDKTTQLNPKRMYRFYMKNPKTIYIAGENASFESITIHQGWNRIGYLSTMNLPIATALADYTDAASEGDIIKSQSEFAVLSIDAMGNRMWKGTLEYLRTGEGYMLRRQAATDYKFWYPYYSTGTKYNTAGTRKAPIFRNTTGSSMNVIARVEDFDLKPGDRLVVYEGTEVRGMAEIDSLFTQDNAPLFFLSVGASEQDLHFILERDGEPIATTTQSLTYVDNAVMGTLAQPTLIRFLPVDLLNGDGWYSLQGIRLQKKPTQKGVYIFNGKKVFVK